VHSLAEAIMATAQSAHAARESAQVSLFGDASGNDGLSGLALMVPNLTWTLAETMAHEKDAFGFYFSGHPVENWRQVLDARGVITAAQVPDQPRGEGRSTVRMAGLIEEVRWRTPQNGSGRRYILANLSDPSGQYVASCFNEEAQERLERLAKDNPAVLIDAELKWRDGEDVPRITILTVEALADIAKRTRGRLVVRIEGAHEVEALAAAVAEAQGRGRGELVADVTTGAGAARVVLGRNLLIDAETESRIARALGADRLINEALEPPRLALVG